MLVLEESATRRANQVHICSGAEVLGREAVRFDRFVLLFFRIVHS